MQKNLTIRVRENCSGTLWATALCNNSKILMENHGKCWERRYLAVRNAKALAKRLGVPYSDKVYKDRGC